MGSPPKPWERAGVVPAVSEPAPSVPTVAAPSAAPAIPERPASIAGSSLGGTTAYAGSTYGATASPYSAYSSPYGASPYSRFGTGYGAGSMYGGSMFGTGGYGMGYGGGYGGMAGYGGMGYGGAYGGMGGYGGMNPMMGDPNAPMSLTAHLESTTQQTFQLLHSIVQTFGGFAQMLESTFMATHSSFFAMVGVADQFAQLRGVLGQVLGLFGLLRWLKAFLRGEATPSMSDEFRGFLKNPPTSPSNPAGTPTAPVRRPSRKPLFVFLLAIFGIPYLMNRLIRYLSSLPRLPPGVTRGPNGTFIGRGGEVLQTGPRGELMGPDGRPILGMDGRAWLINGPQGQVAGPEVDPSKLEFARALWAFDAAKGNEAVELSLAKGEIVAILSKGEVLKSADGNASGGDWWRGRTRSGREGWFPATFVEIIKKPDSSAPASVVGAQPKKVD